MDNNKIIKLLSIPLSAHLLYSTTILLIQHFGIYYKEEASAFDVALRIIFAFTYSLITVIFLNKYPKLSLIIILAVLV